jgi:hypothetical protein
MNMVNKSIKILFLLIICCSLQSCRLTKEIEIATLDLDGKQITATIKYKVVDKSTFTSKSLNKYCREFTSKLTCQELLTLNADELPDSIGVSFPESEIQVLSIIIAGCEFKASSQN